MEKHTVMTNDEALKVDKVKIITFYLIACAISWPMYALRDLHPDIWESFQLPNGVRSLGIMWGPGLSALICLFIFKKTHVRTITFFGTSWGKSLLFYLIPFSILTVISFINPVNGFKVWFFIQMMPFGFLMILGEELGWRGFLQDGLKPMKEYKKWLLIGLMWEIWHFTRGVVHGELPAIIIRKAIFIACVFILTVIIGKFTNRTKSLLVAVSLHSWINILFEFPNINTYLTLLVSVVFWCFLLMKWGKGSSKDKKKDHNNLAEQVEKTLIRVY